MLKTKKLKIVSNYLFKLYGQVEVSKAEVIVAVGGDGAMLAAMRESILYDIPVFGLNRGNIGFLMNEYNNSNLIDRLKQANEIIVHPLEMIALDTKIKHTELAINEVALFRRTHQSAIISIKIDDTERLSELTCDGIMVATPVGSTAYNLSAHGPILPIGSEIFEALTPISLSDLEDGGGALIKNNSIIEFNIINPKMRPVSASADAYDVKNISKVSISQKKNDINLRILYDKTNSMEDKYLKEQFSIG